MRASTKLQNEIVRKLREHNFVAIKEWDISKDADDDFSRQFGTYAPRPDVAVGPFNISRGNKRNKIKSEFLENAPERLKHYIGTHGLRENENPRCALAIEVAYSGSSKHMLGDITNASMMGLYGFVVASESTLEKLKRILKYVETSKHLHKTPDSILSNVCVISDEGFLNLLQSD